MIEGVLNVADQMADLVWAGRISAQSIAGLGVAQSYVHLTMTGRMGFDTAMRAMISRAVGARDLALANHVALQAFTLSGAFAVLTVIIGVFLTVPLMRLLGVSDEVIAAGADYMRVQFIGQGTTTFRMMSGAALQASGDAVTPMKATTCARVLHILLSPCLVFGWLFFPALGLPGAAIANVVAQLVGVAMNFYALFAGRSRLHLSLEGYRVDFPLLWRIVKLGAPASVTGAERTIAQLVLFGVAARFGDYVLAAYSLTRRIETVTHLGSQGIGQASGVIVGQNLGAGRPERARQTVLWGIIFSILVTATMSTLMFVFAEPFLSVFSEQRDLLEVAVIWLRIQAVGYVFIGGANVFMHSFNTAGDTLIPMIVTLVSIWGVQQPLAFILPEALGLQQYGVAWAINVAILVRYLVYVPYYVWGPWMKKSVAPVRRHA